jgi:uncharacterized membrane protein YobD (UPF0266 family)
MTVAEYDERQFKDLLKQAAIPIVLIAFLHYKYAVVVPLVTSSVMALMKLYESNIVQVCKIIKLWGFYFVFVKFEYFRFIIIIGSCLWK